MLWRIGQFPELDHLEPMQRAKVLGNVPWWTYPSMIARALTHTIIVVMLAGLVIAIIQPAIALNPPAVLIPMLVILTLLTTAFYLNEVNKLRTQIRAELAAAFRGERPPFCFACGYNLRESKEPVCPECGKPVANRSGV